MHGDLSETSTPDLCRRLAESAATGVLTVEGPDGAATIVVRDGHVVAAASPAPPAREARDRVRDAVVEVARWPYGAFRFEPGLLPEAAGEPTVLDELDEPITVAELLAEVARCEAAEPQLADLDAIPVPHEHAETAALTADQRQVVGASDGSRTIRRLALELGRGGFEVARTVAPLVRSGVLELRPPQDEVGRALEDAIASLTSRPVDPPSPAPPANPAPPESTDQPASTEPAPAADPGPSAGPARTGEISELLRELSRLASEEPPPREVPPPRRGTASAPRPESNDAPPGRRRRRFGRG